jgi:hypothetical protein
LAKSADEARRWLWRSIVSMMASAVPKERQAFVEGGDSEVSEWDIGHARPANGAFPNVMAWRGAAFAA